MPGDVGEAPTEQIVNEIASREGLDNHELEPPLGTVLDAEALDSLVAFPSPDVQSRDGYVRFPYVGYIVTVRFDGSVRVDAE